MNGISRNPQLVGNAGFPVRHSEGYSSLRDPTHAPDSSSLNSFMHLAQRFRCLRRQVLPVAAIATVSAWHLPGRAPSRDFTVPQRHPIASATSPLAATSMYFAAKWFRAG